MANIAMGEHFSWQGNFKKSDEYIGLNGAILDWQAVGPFENISASGFTKNYAPITHPESNYTFKNKHGADIKWFTLPKTRPGRWINLAKHFYISNSIIYTQTFINSPKEQTVILRIGTSGSLKVFLNDSEIFTEKKERNNDIDTYTIKTTLSKGYNRLLLQIGESELNSSNFMVRITDAKGNLLNSSLNITAETQSYTKTDVKGEFIPFFAEEYFKQKIESNPNDLMNYILLAKVYMHNDKNYDARKILNKAQKIAPDCSYLLWMLIKVYYANENRTDLSLALEKLKKDDPENPISLILLFEEEFDNENYTEATKILDKMYTRYGNNATVLEDKIKLALAEERIEDFVKHVNTAYLKYPNNYTFVNYTYLTNKEIKKNTQGAIIILKKYLKKNYNTSAKMELAKLYLDYNPSMGIATIKEMIQNEPTAVGYINNLGELYFLMGRYNDAKKQFEKCIELAPNIGSYYAQLGKAYEETKNLSKAMELYKTAIEYNSTDYETRKKLRKLEDKKENIFEYFEEPDLEALYKKAPSKDDYLEDNSIIFADDIQRVIYTSGGSEEKHYLGVKVFNKEGIDEWKEYYIGYTNSQSLFIEKAEVLKKDGNKLKAEINRNHIVFTSLEEGDAITLIYRVENYQFGKLAKHFWDKHYFTHYYPYTYSKFSLLVPKNTKFSYDIPNSNLKPKITEGAKIESNPEQEFSLYVWEKTNQKSIKHEDYMPNINDVGEVLHISSIPDWDYVSKWYLDLSQTKADDDFEVKEIIEELFGETKDQTDKEKVKIIYNYIVSNIRYSSVSFRQSGLIPQKASKTLNTKIGDCKDVSTLFVAMCKELDIPAELVLINTRKYGLKDLALPSIAFNHCIAKVTLNNEDYYVELTSDYNPFSTLGYSLKKCTALNINNSDTKNELFVLNPDNRVENSVIRTSKVTFDEYETMTVNKMTLKYGSYSASTRSTYRRIGNEERRKTMSEAIGSDYPNIKLVDLKFDETLNNTSDSICYHYSYKVNNVFTEVSKLKLLKLPWADNEEPIECLSNEKRIYPFEFWKYVGADKKTETLEIEIPKNLYLSEMPKNKNFSCSLGTYSLTFKKDKNKLIATRTITIKNDSISVENFEDFKKFWSQLVKADNTQIGFKTR